MKCPFCQTEIDDNAKFCYCCGSNVSDADAVEKTIQEMGNSVDHVMDELEQTAAASTAALNGEETVLADDYDAALKKAEEIANGKDLDSELEPEIRAAQQKKAEEAAAGRPGNARRASNLLAALWDSGKLKKAVLGAVALIAVLLLLFKGPGLFGKKEPQVQEGGYGDYKQLVSDYIQLVSTGKYDKAVTIFAPEVVSYYKEAYSENPEEIVFIADDAYQADVYGNVKSWVFGDTLEWDAAEYYADVFADLGITAKKGMDVQVVFTFKDGAESDYYVFELINQKGKWQLLSVYY